MSSIGKFLREVAITFGRCFASVNTGSACFRRASGMDSGGVWSRPVRVTSPFITKTVSNLSGRFWQPAGKYSGPRACGSWGPALPPGLISTKRLRCWPTPSVSAWPGVVRWAQRARTTGSTVAKPMGGRRPVLLAGAAPSSSSALRRRRTSLRALPAELAVRVVFYEGVLEEIVRPCVRSCRGRRR